MTVGTQAVFGQNFSALGGSARADTGALLGTAASKLQQALDRLDRGQAEAKAQGQRLRDASNQAAAQAITLLAKMGASVERLGELVQDLTNRLNADLSAQGDKIPNIPEGGLAAQRFSLSVEIERVSVQADDKGNLSIQYERVSLSITTERYASSLGASDKQVAEFFANKGKTSTGLLLPEKSATDAADDAKELYRLLLPIDPKPGLWRRDA